MAARQATAKLTRLERLDYGTRYRFDMEPHSQIEKMLLNWASYRLYGMTIEYDAVTTGKKRYTISNDGMWMLSHLFVNWEEMTTDAHTTYYEPDEPVWANCGQCGKLCSPLTIYYCTLCKKRLCDECKVNHIRIHVDQTKYNEQADRCDGCGRPGTVTQCATCKQHFCGNCSVKHVLDNPHAETHKQEERFTGRGCSRCGVPEMRSGPFQTCQFCSKLFCGACFTRHVDMEENEQQSFTYDWLRDYFAYRDSFQRYGSNYRQSSTGTGTHTQTRPIPTAVQQALNVLGVSAVNANKEAINGAYRKKAKSIHPDIGGKEKEMVKLNLARETALKWMKDTNRA